eukprot:COSAG06_NODE_8183_length_2246_cov_1.569632_3_plen_134_part_00
MNDSYSTITQLKGHNQRRRLQAFTTIEAENTLSETHMCNKDWFPEFIEVLEPVSDVHSPLADASTITDTARRTENNEREVSAMKSREEVKHEVARVEQKVDAVERKVEVVAAEMKANQALIMEQLRKMASIGA